MLVVPAGKVQPTSRPTGPLRHRALKKRRPPTNADFFAKIAIFFDKASLQR